MLGFKVQEKVPDWCRIQPTLGTAFSVKPPGKQEEINIAPRSLMGALFYLSHIVEVPQWHEDAGLVAPTGCLRNVIGCLLRVYWSWREPIKPAVAVQYKGYWFYIDNADRQSKTTLALLAQLFALQAGKEVSVPSLLTLPVPG